MNIDILTKTIPRPVVMFFYSMIFVLAVISSAGLINIFLPSSNIPQNLDDISTKFEYFAKYKDDYDVIFLGSSTTYQGVVPKVFDETMAANGRRIKSFNFGIMGANIAEMDFYLEKILALKPANLKWIFLDCLVNGFMENAPTAAKNVYWHTPLKTIENFQLIAESNYDFKEKIRGFYANSISFIYRWLGIGYFSSFWQQSPDKLPATGLQKVTSSDKLLQEAGYYAMDWMKDSEEWNKTFQSKYLESYQQRLEKAKSGVFEQNKSSTYPKNSSGIKIINKVIHKIDKSESSSNNKIVPVFLIPPVLDSDADPNSIMTAYDLGYISTLFAFNNPNTFATLYELDRRADGRHLNHQGAEEFTRILATEFSKHLKLSQNGISQRSPISISQN
ncbi:hypothetical protein H6G76_06965 [Nostoc sp. FACHB-152]|uniref:hypothetical protein n=1 Tax=unclassified Nostoc TaxID=2593658 RepID=UPI001684A387|nr:MULTISPECIES: hypothetical protein [unclassified Nostoc]MBD2446907.1 hypothetical protein [Nostoc sp. FACHB-152]MBD2467756.1 hypothetical protein [Nostoc sp. FACHB-145]